MTMNKTKGFLAAALTSATLATPAQADDVFYCVLDELDSRIADLTDIIENFEEPRTAHGPLFELKSLEATYSHEQKMEIIEECEQSTGQQSNRMAEGLTKYSNGGSVTLFFKPQ